MLEAVIVPIMIALIGGPLMWLLARLDRNNSAQHQNNMRVLERIEGKVTRIEDKVGKVNERLDNHIDKHHRSWINFGGKRDRDSK